MTDEIELRRNDRERVLEVFTRELPHTARILNPPAVTEEIVFGPDHETPDDDERPPQEWYDRHETVMAELVGDGILQTGQAMGMTVYGLTIGFQNLLEAQAVTYLENKAKLLRNRTEDAKKPDESGALLERAIQIERAKEAMTAPVVAKVQP